MPHGFTKTTRSIADVPAMGEFIEAWVCDKPPPGSSYQVLRDMWLENPDGTMVRAILEIRMQEPEPVIDISGGFAMEVTRE